MSNLTAKLEQPIFETVREAAKAALDQCDGKWVEATSLLVEWVHSNDALYRQLADPLISQAAYNEVRSLAHSTRRKFKVTNYRVGEDNVGGLVRIAEKNFLDWPLQGGLKLGDASREDLQKEIDLRDMLVKKNAEQAEWFRRIASKMGRHKKVRNALNSDELAELLKEAETA